MNHVLDKLGAPLLSDADHQYFDEHGFLVVKNVVPIENCEAVVNACFEFLELDQHDPSTWYPSWRGGNALVHLHQHQTLWNNRQHPRMHQAFAELLGTEKLWVSLDRAGFKPPITPAHPEYNDRGFIHWDTDTSRPYPEKLGVQGVLCLRDTDEKMGGFRCVPGFHRREVLEPWFADQPADRNPRAADLSKLPPGFEVTPIPADAGDLIIWNKMLLHGNGRNEGDRPRLAQYITMFTAPADLESEGAQKLREERIASWRERRSPNTWLKDIPERFQDREKQNPPAELSELGRKLLGLDAWE